MKWMVGHTGSRPHRWVWALNNRVDEQLAGFVRRPQHLLEHRLQRNRASGMMARLVSTSDRETGDRWHVVWWRILSTANTISRETHVHSSHTDVRKARACVPKTTPSPSESRACHSRSTRWIWRGTLGWGWVGYHHTLPHAAKAHSTKKERKKFSC